MLSHPVEGTAHVGQDGRSQFSGEKGVQRDSEARLKPMHFIGDRTDGQRDLCVIYIRTVVTIPPREKAPGAARMVAGATPRQSQTQAGARESEGLRAVLTRGSGCLKDKRPRSFSPKKRLPAGTGEGRGSEVGGR